MSAIRAGPPTRGDFGSRIAAAGGRPSSLAPSRGVWQGPAAHLHRRVHGPRRSPAVSAAEAHAQPVGSGVGRIQHRHRQRARAGPLAPRRAASEVERRAPAVLQRRAEVRRAGRAVGVALQPQGRRAGRSLRRRDDIDGGRGSAAEGEAGPARAAEEHGAEARGGGGGVAEPGQVHPHRAAVEPHRARRHRRRPWRVRHGEGARHGPVRPLHHPVRPRRAARRGAFRPDPGAAGRRGGSRLIEPPEHEARAGRPCCGARACENPDGGAAGGSARRWVGIRAGRGAAGGGG
jgi:hypothetical protein